MPSLTHDQFVNRLKNTSPKVLVLGKYQNSQSRIRVRCKVCQHIWEPIAYQLSSLCQGCPKCAKASLGLSLRKDPKEFEDYIRSTFPNLRIISPYVTARIQVGLRCSLHEREWYCLPWDVHNCLECANSARVLSKEEFLNRLAQTRFVYVSGFQGAKGFVKVKCRDCGNISRKRVSGIEGRGCVFCFHERMRRPLKTTKEFCKQIRTINPDISVITNYKGSLKSIKCRCLKDGNVWTTTPKLLLMGIWCPRCSQKQYSAKAIAWLDILSRKLGISIQHAGNAAEFKIPGTRYRADGYSSGIIFEFLGDYYHGNPRVFQQYDPLMSERYSRTKIKLAKLRKLGYQIVYVWEVDFHKQHLGETLGMTLPGLKHRRSFR